MNTLTRIQGIRYKRAQTTYGFLTEQDQICKLYEPFAEEVANLSGNYKQLLILVPEKDVDGASITTSKEDIKLSIATLGNIICTRVTAYAKKTGNIDLQKAIYRRTSEIARLQDANVLSFVTKLVANVTPLLTDELFKTYAVTSTMLDTIGKMGTDFNNSIGKAELVDNTSSFASRNINDILKKIAGNIAQLSLLVNFFQDDYPGFVDGFYKAIALNNTGIRHSGIEGIITNPATGQPVKGVTITGEGKKKIATTDKEGAYKLVKLKIGDMKITITAPGYDTQVVDVTIKRGKVIELNVSLHAQVISMSTTA